MVRSGKLPEGFGSEQQLVQVILDCAQRSRARRFSSFLELDAGVGFADIVFCSRRPRSARATSTLSRIQPRLAPLLDPGIAAQITSRDDLQRALGLSKGPAQRVIQQLRQLDILNSHGDAIRLATVKSEPFPYIVAVEAKLSKWQAALAQAYRNRQFADESWVVLDHRCYAAGVAKIDRFETSGVGLASVSASGQLFIHQPAIPASPISTTKRWHAQAALARRVTAGSHP